MKPPVAARRPTVPLHFGDERTDDYFWLRNDQDPDVIAYPRPRTPTPKPRWPTPPRCNNGCTTRSWIGCRGRHLGTRALRRLRKYFHRTFAGRQYPSHCRRRLDADARAAVADEEIVIDENVLAAGHEFFQLANLDISPDHTPGAYGGLRTAPRSSPRCAT